jgi:uncharacterized protein (DUF58 family)
VALFALGLLPAIFGVLSPVFFWITLGLDAAVVLGVAIDFALSPGQSDLRVQREVADVLSSGAPNPVALVVERLRDRSVRGVLRDLAPASALAEGHQQAFSLSGDAVSVSLPYRLTPPTRGDLTFGDVFARLAGPLGLCARQLRFAAAQSVKVYPDLRGLSKEALALARAQDASANRVVRRAAEGREFESLREYRSGDDYRTVDWKATARRGEPIVRVQQPERNQAVLLFLDCGRQMAGQVDGRRKLDHAVDAALKLARICQDQGDQVGVVAFAQEVLAFLPPGRGVAHLQALTRALYRIEATLTESDYGRAVEQAFSRFHRRALVVMMTDLLDRDSSAALVKRMVALRPRHLPLVASMLDEDVQRIAREVPQAPLAAYEREVAQRVEADYRLTAAQLRERGALVVRTRARALSAATVNEYLHVKARGLL